MYITTKCKHCEKESVHEITVHCIENTTYVDGQDTRSYVLDDITVKDSLTEEDLTELIIQILLKHSKMHEDSEGLIHILKTVFGCSDQLAKKIAGSIESEKKEMVSELKEKKKVRCKSK